MVGGAGWLVKPEAAADGPGVDDIGHRRRTGFVVCFETLCSRWNAGRFKRGFAGVDDTAAAMDPCLADTAEMPSEDSLKRLGAGRWETRDGRFAIEPQSGTWVVVDNSQTDELGLPLVRGPFGSLTAVREAIEGVRTTGSAESPLAGRLKEAEAARAKGLAPDGKPRRPAATETPVLETPMPPPEPKWLRDLAPADRRRARDLIKRLERLDIAEADAIARAEIALDQPALTRLAIERSLREAVERATDPKAAVRAATGALLHGRDRELDVRWRVVDERGRPVDDVDLSD